MPDGDTGSFDYSQGRGWFVGWARRGERVVDN
jgi:beta-lactamase class D